ncbi:MAG: hypothetical protein ACRDZ7_05810, partial [Acidimicrobiia bacterium]
MNTHSVRTRFPTVGVLALIAMVGTACGSRLSTPELQAAQGQFPVAAATRQAPSAGPTDAGPA